MLDIGEKTGVPAIDESAKNAAGKFVGKVFNALVDTGKIIRAEINGQAAYRTRMKTEKIA